MSSSFERAPRGARAAKILCRTGEHAGATFDIERDVTVGRAGDADIVVSSDHISRSHARIWFEDGRWWIDDLDSRNGTRVDGTPVHEPTVLEHLHVITFGDMVDFVFVSPRPAASTEDAKTSAGPSEEAAEARPTSRKATPRERVEGADEEAAEGPDEERPRKPHPKGTVADLSAFGELPDLEVPDQKDATEPEPRSASETPTEPADTDDSEPDEKRPRKPHPKGTVADLSAFGELPDLEVPDQKDATEPEPRPTSETPAEPADTDHSEPDEKRPRKPHPKGTVADLSAFGELPDLEVPDQKDATEPEPRSASETPTEPADADDSEPDEVDGEEPDEAGGDASDGRSVAADVAVPHRRRTLPHVSEILDRWRKETEAREAPSAALKLRVTVPDSEVPLSFSLGDGDHVLGRSSTCDITIPDPQKTLSRRHALVRVEDGAVTLVDLDSSNGTWIEGERVDEATLEPGDSFMLGPSISSTLVSR